MCEVSIGAPEEELEQLLSRIGVQPLNK